MDTTGLYEKFHVIKNEGRPEFQGEHFVLFPRRDNWARDALEAYADACLAKAPELANAIMSWLAGIYAEERAESQESP